MKIVFTANSAWSMYNFRKGVLSKFISLGHEVHIVAPKDQSVDKLLEMGCIFSDVNINRKGTNPLEDIKLVFNLYQIYQSIRPDFIFHYTIKPNIYGSIAAKLANVKTIAITTGLGYVFTKTNLLTKFVHLLYKISFKFPIQVWFLNEDDKSVFLEHHLVEQSQAFLLDSEGIDIDYFKPMDSNKNDNKIRFLLIARMLEDKGILEFVDAARKIRSENKDVIFQLLGPIDLENPTGIPKKTIENWHNQGVVEYLGTTNDVRQYIADADCIVLPSKYKEGVPRTLMEGAALGKPLISTDISGCKETILNGQTGFLAKPSNAESLKNALVDFLKLDSINITKMGIASKEYISKRFDEKKVIDQYIKTITL